MVEPQRRGRVQARARLYDVFETEMRLLEGRQKSMPVAGPEALAAVIRYLNWTLTQRPTSGPCLFVPELCLMMSVVAI